MFVSYAQAREDVILHRALKHVHHNDGFYIDVGGYHPNEDSVTKHFYDHGWHGINIEPSNELFDNFVRERDRDINLKVAITDTPGTVRFHAVDGQLGTLEHRVAETHNNLGINSHSYEVDATTLTQICEQHAPRDIHFLKIDVEGHEKAALRGMDFTRFRPWILVVEATEPNRLDLLTHHEWEGIIMSSGYQFVMSHLPNRYYVANEHSHLASCFTVPVDDYITVHHRREIDRLRKEIEHVKSELSAMCRSISSGS